jgi:adenylylsulfate kinase-like enzyme
MPNKSNKAKKTKSNKAKKTKSNKSKSKSNKSKSKKTKSNKSINIPVIHISGPSGAGKSYMGRKLYDIYKNKILVYDTDVLNKDFILKTYKTLDTKEFNIKSMEKYIHRLITDAKVPVIFTGIGSYAWLDKDEKYQYKYYNISATHKFFIDIDIETLIKQKCRRFLNQVTYMYADDEISNNNEVFMNSIVHNTHNSCDKIRNDYSYNGWTRDHKQKKFKFMAPKQIFKEVKTIIDKFI